MASKSSCRSSDDNLVVGRGRTYLDLRINGIYQGERYLGNTPDFTLSSSADKLEHYSSDRGFKVKDKSINIENSRSGSVTTDNISFANVALMFGGVDTTQMQSAQTGIKELVNGGNPVRRARQYQLGVDSDNPQGLGAIDPASFTIGYADANLSISTGDGDISTIPGVTTLPATNYSLDPTTGALWIEDDAPQIVGEVVLVVSYDRQASSRVVVVSGDDVVEGALRFVSDNPTGDQKHYYFPLVSISPDGDYALKGDDWQQLGFTFDVLERDCETKAVYIYGDVKTTASQTLNLSLTAAPTSVPADGTTASTITAKVTETTGVGVAGIAVSFDSSLGTILSSGVTDASGQVQVSLTSTQAGTSTVAATIESTGATKSVSVAFTA